MVFGAKKVQAEATVVAAAVMEHVYRTRIQGAVNVPTWDRCEFVLEVRPPAGAPYRVKVEKNVLPYLRMPSSGDVVSIEYNEKHPDRVELELEGDPRYDRSIERKQQEAVAQQAREVALDQALHAAPGTAAPEIPGLPDSAGRSSAGGAGRSLNQEMESFAQTSESFALASARFLESQLAASAAKERAVNGGNPPAQTLSNLAESHASGLLDDDRYEDLRARLTSGEL